MLGWLANKALIFGLMWSVSWCLSLCLGSMATGPCSQHMKGESVKIKTILIDKKQQKT